MRVVSLLPSATELCCALGVDPVGATHECDYPPRVESLPTVVHSRIDTDGSSAAIDAQVQATAEDGGVYTLDAERLHELDPDVVVSQGLCDVCAVDEAVVRDAVDALGLDADVVTTHPHRLDDVFDDVARIGRAVGRASAADELLDELAARVDRVRERVSGAETPTVTVLDWVDPVMVSGHWMPELVELAGGTARLASPGEVSGPVEFERLHEADPDVLVVAPCGFGLERAADSVAELREHDGWTELRAVREGRVYAMDGNHYVNRPGPRLVDTLEQLAAVFHPERVDAPREDVVRRMPTAVDDADGD